MARHDQKSYADKKPWTCRECRFGDCPHCVDVGRYTAHLVLHNTTEFKPMCACKRVGHSGEPNENQVADPIDGSVHGPGVVVSEGGEVTFDESLRREFRELFK